MKKCLWLLVSVNGTVSRDGYFFEGLNILIGTFCVFTDGFQRFSKAFHYPICTIIQFYLLLYGITLLTNSENANRTVTGECSPVSTSHWLQGKYAKFTHFTGSQAASCMHFLGLWRGLLKGVFKISKNFLKEQALIFFNNKATKNLKNRHHIYRKYLFNIKGLKKYSSRETIPLKKKIKMPSRVEWGSLLVRERWVVTSGDE